MSSSAKRRRTEITPEIKKEICTYKSNNKSATLEDIVNYVQKEFNISIGKSTVSDILSNPEKWLHFKLSSSCSTHQRQPQHENLEECIYTWFLNAHQNGLTVSDKLIKKQSLKLGEALGISSFGYSNGWLLGFKKRYGISCVTLHGEVQSADVEAAEKAKLKLKDILKDYNLLTFTIWTKAAYTIIWIPIKHWTL